MTNNQAKFDYPKEKTEIKLKRKEFKENSLIVKDYLELKKLYLWEIDSIGQITLHNLPQLTEVTIWDCGMKKLVIEKCPQIIELNLSFNSLTNLNFLASLDKLTKLDITGNTKITSGFEYLPSNLATFTYTNTNELLVAKVKYQTLKNSVKAILTELLKKKDSLTTKEVFEQFSNNPQTKEIVLKLSNNSEDLVKENNLLKIENEEYKPLFADQAPELATKELGTGGFGSVYLGKWKTQSVAVKKPFNVQSEQALEAIKKELQLLKNLRSKHTIQYYGEYYNKETNDFFMIMEYAENGSLESFIKKSAYFNLNFSLGMLRDIAQGLAYIHTEGVLHRDLRLANILVTKENVIKISDFGLSILPGKSFKEDKLLGALASLAPELLINKLYTKASDIYSFAMVMYEILTGLEPYRNYDYLSKEEFEDLVGNGSRPDFNDGFLIPKTLEYLENNFEGFLIPKFLEDLIQSCWAQANQRPSANQISELLSTMTNEQQTNEIKEAIKNVDKFNQQLAKISKRVKNNHHFSTSKFVKSKYFSVKESLEQIENTSTFSYQYGNSDSFK